jgi:hypothetical protein
MKNHGRDVVKQTGAFLKLVRKMLPKAILEHVRIIARNAIPLNRQIENKNKKNCQR